MANAMAHLEGEFRRLRTSERRARQGCHTLRFRFRRVVGSIRHRSQTQIIISCPTRRTARDWQFSIKEMMRKAGGDFIQRNRYFSFSPVRQSVSAAWFVDGRSYMSAVATALEQATQEIFIADWWLSPEIYMKRPSLKGDYWRLDVILKRKAIWSTGTKRQECLGTMLASPSREVPLGIWPGISYNDGTPLRGKDSLLVRLRDAGVSNPHDYITFHGLRNHSTLNSYPDEEYKNGFINGQHFLSGRMAGTLRRYLFREHLGLLGNPEPEWDVSDPTSDEFYHNIWKATARRNTEIYDSLSSTGATNLWTSYEKFLSYGAVDSYVQSNSYLQSKWKYWNRPKIENRNGASEKTFSFTHSEPLPEQVSDVLNLSVSLKRVGSWKLDRCCWRSDSARIEKLPRGRQSVAHVLAPVVQGLRIQSVRDSTVLPGTARTRKMSAGCGTRRERWSLSWWWRHQSPYGYGFNPKNRSKFRMSGIGKLRFPGSATALGHFGLAPQKIFSTFGYHLLKPVSQDRPTRRTDFYRLLRTDKCAAKTRTMKPVSWPPSTIEILFLR
ncbi:unnamed protein product, partial [Nesidiocoris tenuis]